MLISSEEIWSSSYLCVCGVDQPEGKGASRQKPVPLDNPPRKVRRTTSGKKTWWDIMLAGFVQGGVRKHWKAQELAE